jgi:hypothetical protein
MARCFLFELNFLINDRSYSVHIDVLPREGYMNLSKGELAMARRVVPATFSTVDLREWLDLDDKYETLTHSAGQDSFFPLFSNGHFKVIDVRFGGIVTRNQMVRYCAPSKGLPASFLCLDIGP